MDSKKQDSRTIQYLVVGVFAILLIGIGIWCFTRKDKFEQENVMLVDPLLEGDRPILDNNMLNFFKSVGADPEHNINDQRYMIACQNCDRSNPRLTPSDCGNCDAFMMGIRRNVEGTL